MDQRQREQYKKRLFEMRDRLLQSAESLRNDVQQSAAATGRLSNQPTHFGDFDSEGIDKFVALAGAEDQILGQVNGAIDRLQRGDYGACERCGGEIARTRLDALPYTPFCAKCAHEVEKERAELEREAS